jgi:peptidoglycan/xylan/chitin deacetylase (PgdA/CDA1 family)
MMRGLAAAALFVAAGLLATAANAQESGNEQVAWFQPRTIFHSGLVGTHTIALTFDDGPNANTRAVLAALKQNNVKATFFIVGKMAKTHPDVLRDIAAEGHLLANHSSTHPFMGASYDEHPEKLIAQLKDVNDQIAPLQPAGTQLFFRAPYGSWKTAHAAILNADPVLKQYIGPIYWDIGGETRLDSNGYVMSSADWNCWHRHWDAQTCAKGYMREIRRHNGGVVLMHCIHSQSGALVAEVVPALVQEGYRFVRLDEVPDYDQYKTPTTPQAPVVAVADAAADADAPRRRASAP